MKQEEKTLQNLLLAAGERHAAQGTPAGRLCASLAHDNHRWVCHRHRTTWRHRALISLALLAFSVALPSAVRATWPYDHIVGTGDSRQAYYSVCYILTYQHSQV